MRGYQRFTVLLTVFLIGAPVASTAQDSGGASDGDLVFAVSRFAQTQADAPASVSVITREEIDRFGWRTIGEILTAARGMYVSYDRNYQYATVRGLARLGDFNTRLLLLLNGRRLSGGFEEGALIGTEAAIDVDALERVEIIHGPGSVMYGNNAFWAVVNLVTRSGQTQPGFTLDAQAGSFRSRQGSVAYGHRAAGFDLFAIASAMKTNGPNLTFREYDDPASNHGRAVGLDGDESAKGFVRIGFGDLTLEALASSRTKQTPTASYETIFGDSRAQVRDSVRMLAASFEHAFTDLSRLWVSTTYHKADYDGAFPYPSALLRDNGSAENWTLEGQYQFFIGRHSAFFGGEVRRTRRVTLGVYDQAPYYSYLDVRRSARTWAMFGQGELKLGSAVTAVIGVRHDWYSTFGGTTNPRIAVVAHLSPKDTVKALYNRAFRAPSPYELFYDDGNVTQKRPDALEPERTDSYELAWERTLGRGLFASASVYRVRVQDMIAMIVDPSDDLMVFRNQDRVRSTGVEIECRGQIAGSFSLRASYAYQKTEEHGSDSAPAGSPRHLARLGISMGIPRVGGSAALELHYVGPRPLRDGGRTGGYTLLNAFVRGRPYATSPVEVFAGVDNLLDAGYGTVGGDEHRQLVIPMDGRTFRLGIQARIGGRTR